MRVFQAEESTLEGFAGPGPYIAMEGTSITPYTLAHELAHAICRHGNERGHIVETYSSTADHWRLGSFLLRGLVWWRLPAFEFCSLAVAQRLFNDVNGPCVPFNARMDVSKLWSWVDLPGRWGQLLRSSVQSTSSAGSAAFLRPGQPGFYAPGSASRSITAELEAERLALLIMARWGRRRARAPFCNALSYYLAAASHILLSCNLPVGPGMTPARQPHSASTPPVCEVPRSRPLSTPSPNMQPRTREPSPLLPAPTAAPPVLSIQMTASWRSCLPRCCRRPWSCTGSMPPQQNAG